MSGLTEQSTAVSCTVSTTILNNVAKAAPDCCRFSYSSCCVMAIGCTSMLSIIIFPPEGDFSFHPYFSRWRHPVRPSLRLSADEWKCEKYFYPPLQFHSTSLMSWSWTEQRWSGKVGGNTPCVTVPSRLEMFPLLIIFYGAFWAGMQVPGDLFSFNW